MPYFVSVEYIERAVKGFLFGEDGTEGSFGPTASSRDWKASSSLRCNCRIRLSISLFVEFYTFAVRTLVIG